MDGTKTTGNHFEGVAARYLASRGVRILSAMSTIAAAKSTSSARMARPSCSFEVRYRGTGSLVDPASSINYPKQKRLIRAVSFYLHRHGLWNSVSRIDVVAISPGTVKKYRVQWIRNAILAG